MYVGILTATASGLPISVPQTLGQADDPLLVPSSFVAATAAWQVFFDRQTVIDQGEGAMLIANRPPRKVWESGYQVK